MTAHACPCGGTTFTEFAERCEHPGCDSFGDHQDGTDERRWCQWHCPSAECVAERTPKRIQLRRTKGWRKPEGAIVVARPSQWGNPFVIGGNQPELFVHDGSRVLWTTPRSNTSHAEARAEATRLFRATYAESSIYVEEAIRQLRGHDLACWCPLDQPCHADVLLELANA